MCKILSNDKKCELKKFQTKKVITKKLTLSGLNDIVSRDFNSSFSDFPDITKNHNNISSNEFSNCLENNSLCKREKSRIAAKKRRTQENENLSELYISLPVATQSKLLSCYDNQFIGNFEKATIIKISAFVLNLYNSLSNLLFDNSYQFDKHPLVSLFSQSIFGLFWCDKTTKLIFSSPGLARLTGLYWCNMIGMPRSSIIVECGSQDSSNMIFLRFMMGALKDRGIFTVNPQRSGNSKQSEEFISEKYQSNHNQAKRDFIGKLPCSVWCSQKLPNGITFDLIQPLMIKSESFSHGNKFNQSHKHCPYRLPIFTDMHIREIKRPGHRFTSFHYLDSLCTMSVSGDFYSSLGYLKENFSKSNLLSFFHFDDIIQVSKHVNEVLSGVKKIQVGIARLCTPKIDKYRWCRYIFQINSIKDISESNFKSHRSSVCQGESYSQNFVRLSTTLNKNNINSTDFQDDIHNCWLEASFSLCHYFNEYQPDFASVSNGGLTNLDKKYTNLDCNKPSSVEQVQQFLQKDSPINLFEESSWYNISTTPIGHHTDLNYNRETLQTNETNFPYYQEQESILLKELMRPVKNYC